MHRIWRSVRGAAVEFLLDWRAVARYLAEPETHVYAFSIAANVLLAFWPFMLVMLSIARHVLNSPAAVNGIRLAIVDYFKETTGGFLARNLIDVALANVHRVEWLSVLLLLFTANGVFLPLEVALNRAWGVTKSRSLLMNQVVSMWLIFACGSVVLLSGVVTGSGEVIWHWIFGAPSQAPQLLLQVLFKLTSIPFTVLVVFLVYWKLPNTKVPWREVLPRAAVVALLLEAMKWVNLAIYPWVYRKFEREYSIFRHSVTILVWSFFAGLIVLAGADWSARKAREEEMAARKAAPETPAAAPLEACVSPCPAGRIG
ncbi:MAG: YihY/virulence factor BrkB family protein [Bryobacteraceae bacterium]